MEYERDRSKQAAIAKKLNQISEEGIFFEDFLLFAVVQLEDRGSSGLEYHKFTTSLYRRPLKHVKPVLADVVRRSLRHCLARRSYKESIDTNLRNFVEQGYLAGKLGGL
jgi:hypothetical protein